MDPPPERHTNTVKVHRRIHGITSRKFHAVAGRVTGWIQICCGIGAFAINVIQMAMASLTGYLGFGIWGSVLVLQCTKNL